MTLPADGTRALHRRERPVRYNGGMDLRTLAPDDIDAALELWRRTEHLGTVERGEVERLLAHDPDLVLAAVDVEGVLLGVVLGSYDGRRGWINRLAVDTAARRRGVGRALVGEVERRLADRGCHRVNLLVFDHNEGGRALWASLGYTATEQVVLYSRVLDEADEHSNAC